jgi:hypothetical protein
MVSSSNLGQKLYRRWWNLSSEKNHILLQKNNIVHEESINATKLRGFSPQANYTDQATADCRRS